MDVKLKDFQLVNQWKLDEKGPEWSDDPSPRYLIDETTGRKYWNESEKCVRIKCLLLTLGTPFVHPITSIINVGMRVLKLVTFSHFWIGKREWGYDFKARLLDAGKDLLRIVATPIALVGLELAAVYGLARPYDGRKLYATIERAMYGRFILAPCFQPRPKYHFFGGNPNQQNAF